MIKTVAIFVVCGLAYLYALENVGNFITRDLKAFEDKLKQDEAQSEAAYRSSLLRRDLSDLVELLLDSATDEELKVVHQQTVRVDMVLQSAKVNPKIDREALVERMYQKRIVADVLTARRFTPTTEPEIEKWAAIEAAVTAQLAQESPQARKARGLISNVTSIVLGAVLLYFVSRYKPQTHGQQEGAKKKVRKEKQR